MDDLKAHQEINDKGCAWGRVNRSKIENVVEDVNGIQRWLQAIMVVLLAQMVAFIAAMFWFVASRAIP